MIKKSAISRVKEASQGVLGTLGDPLSLHAEDADVFFRLVGEVVPFLLDFENGAGRVGVASVELLCDLGPVARAHHICDAGRVAASRNDVASLDHFGDQEERLHRREVQGAAFHSDNTRRRRRRRHFAVGHWCQHKRTSSVIVDSRRQRGRTGSPWSPVPLLSQTKTDFINQLA